MKHLIFLRAMSLTLASVLAIAAMIDLTVLVMRPTVRAEVLFMDGARLPPDLNKIASTISLDGDTRSDIAALAALRVLLAPPDMSDRAAANKAAQEATISALQVSPVNSLMWLALGLLKAQLNEPAGQILKVSYLAGALRRDAVLRRVNAVVTTDAVTDEEIRLLAQSDIRTILTKYSQLEPGLAAAYRQASPNGKAFVLDSTAVIDPRFSQILRQYP